MLVNQRSFLRITLAACLVTMATAADATSSQFDDAFGTANGLLDAMSTQITGLKTSGVLTADALGTLDGTMSAYAKAVSEAGAIAFKNAAAAADSKGAEGNVDDLATFEKGMQEAASTMSKSQTVMNDLAAAIQGGKIRLENEKGGELRLPGIKNRYAACTTKSACLDNGMWLADALGYAFSELVIGRAEAAVAVPCVPMCSAQNWPSCATCVVSAGPEAIKAYSVFQDEWGQCGKQPGGWLVTACRFGAVFRFVVKLA